MHDLTARSVSLPFWQCLRLLGGVRRPEFCLARERSPTPGTFPSAVACLLNYFFCRTYPLFKVYCVVELFCAIRSPVQSTVRQTRCDIFFSPCLVSPFPPLLPAQLLAPCTWVQRAPHLSLVPTTTRVTFSFQRSPGPTFSPLPLARHGAKAQAVPVPQPRVCSATAAVVFSNLNLSKKKHAVVAVMHAWQGK